MKNSDKIILAIGGLLVALAIFKPHLPNIVKPVDNVPVVEVEDISDELKTLVQPVIDALKAGSKDRKIDGIKLANLYNDMGTLISLKDNDTVIKTTNDIKNANSLAGHMLQLSLKDKYPDLGKACTEFVINVIGGDDIALDDELRSKAVLAFKALAWACKEGSK